MLLLIPYRALILGKTKILIIVCCMFLLNSDVFGCKDSKDCANGFTCDKGKCVGQCTGDNSNHRCGFGRHCLQFRCQLITDSSVCRLPIKIGTCGGTSRVYGYNSSSGDCESFSYSGCGGNDNKFSDRDDCKTLCKKNPQACPPGSVPKNDSSGVSCVTKLNDPSSTLTHLLSTTALKLSTAGSKKSSTIGTNSKPSVPSNVQDESIDKLCNRDADCLGAAAFCASNGKSSKQCKCKPGFMYSSDKRSCIKYPALGESCRGIECLQPNSVCLPHPCPATVNCTCQCDSNAGFKAQGSHCVRPRVKLDEVCQTSIDCAAPLSECKEVKDDKNNTAMKCKCMNGFTPTDNSLSCGKATCSTGDPHKKDGTLTLCTKALSSGSFSFCPDGYYCVAFTEMVSLTETQGFCCPMPPPKCPLGDEPSGYTNCSSCPLATHYCHYDRVAKNPMRSKCCRKPCKNPTDIFLNMQCYPQLGFGDTCEIRQQCRIGIVGMNCRAGAPGAKQCLCPPGYVPIANEDRTVMECFPALCKKSLNKQPWKYSNGTVGRCNSLAIPPLLGSITVQCPAGYMCNDELGICCAADSNLSCPAEAHIFHGTQCSNDKMCASSGAKCVQVRNNNNIYSMSGICCSPCPRRFIPLGTSCISHEDCRFGNKPVMCEMYGNHGTCCGVS